jgi:hypothetical protein
MEMEVRIFEVRKLGGSSRGSCFTCYTRNTPSGPPAGHQAKVQA